MKEILLILMISILCERYVFIRYISMINDNSVILWYNIRGYTYKDNCRISNKEICELCTCYVLYCQILSNILEHHQKDKTLINNESFNKIHNSHFHVVPYLIVKSKLLIICAMLHLISVELPMPNCRITSSIFVDQLP